MNQNKIIQLASALLLACMLAFGLAACAYETDANTDANQNRQCLSTMNGKMGEIKTVMEEFEEAASNGNVVGMRSQLDKADAIKAEIEGLEASDALADAKADYVEALAAMNGVMESYVDVYGKVKDKTMTEAEVSEAVSGIQAEYDKAIEQLQAADQAISELAG